MRFICDYLKPIIVGVSILYIVGFTVWLFDMQKLMTQLVEQGKTANLRFDQNEAKIKINTSGVSELDDRVNDHEVRIKVIESK